LQPPYKYTYKYIIYIFLYFIRNHVARHSISYSRPRLSGAFLIYVVCKMSGTPKSDNENVKLLLTGQLWTMGLYEYIVCAILFPPITVLYSHMFWHRGSIGCLASPDNAALYKSFQMPALNRAADTSTLRTWPTRLALKLSLKLVQTIGQPASQLPRLRSPSLLGKYKKKKTYIKLIRYLSLRRQSQSAQAFSS